MWHFNPHELRDPFGRWTRDGDAGDEPDVDLSDALKAWTEPDTYPQVSDAAMNELKTGNVGSGDAAAQAHAIIHAMATQAEPSRQELYRGVGLLDSEVEDFKRQFAEGTVFDSGLSSFSADWNVAREFSDDGGLTPAQFYLEPGANGLNLGSHSLQNEEEWITAGRFRVVSMGMETDPDDGEDRLIVRIRQEVPDEQAPAVAA